MYTVIRVSLIIIQNNVYTKSRQLDKPLNKEQVTKYTFTKQPFQQTQLYNSSVWSKSTKESFLIHSISLNDLASVHTIYDPTRTKRERLNDREIFYVPMVPRSSRFFPGGSVVHRMVVFVSTWRTWAARYERSPRYLPPYNPLPELSLETVQRNRLRRYAYKCFWVRSEILRFLVD